MEVDVASNLADNIRYLREKRGLSQAQIAKQAGLPRPTWANIESGGANPTLAVLVKVSSALQVGLEELLGPPRVSAKFYRAEDLPVKKRGSVTIRKLLPESISGLEIDRFELPAGSSIRGIPHTVGTREYLTCERGEIELSESGRVFKLGPGDVVVFRGDQKHGYRNSSRRIAVAYSVVALA